MEYNPLRTSRCVPSQTVQIHTIKKMNSVNVSEFT